MSPSRLNPRIIARLAYLACAFVCFSLIGFALYLQYVVGEDPCPLCMVQRIAFILVGTIALVAAAHGPRRAAAVVYGALLMLASGAGGAVAARHVWLQSLPKHLVPECGPGLDFILERFPMAKALDLILRGSGECAEKGWTFLGLTIAGWSLVWFVTLFVAALAITWYVVRRR